MKAVRRSLAVIGLAVVMVVVLLAGAAQARTYFWDEVRFFELINAYRAQYALAPLLASDAAAEAAARHSLDMGTYGFFGHTTEQSLFFPVGSAPWDRMSLTGYPTADVMGENIAAGQQSAQEVFAAWRDSASHRAIMLDPDFRVIGIGRRVALFPSYKVFWTADFGSAVDASAHGLVAAMAAPFTDVTERTEDDPELYDAAFYVKSAGYFQGYLSGALGCWDGLTRGQVALVMQRAGLGSRSQWLNDYTLVTRGEVMEAFPGLTWNSRFTERVIYRSELVRLLYRAR